MPLYDNRDRLEREAWVAIGLPADDPIAFDHQLWIQETLPRARRAFSHRRRSRLWTPWSLAAALLLTMLLAIPYWSSHHAPVQPSTKGKPSAPLTWSGTGPMVTFHMVSPTVGWAVPQTASVVLRTDAGPNHFRAVSRFPIVGSGMWSTYYFGTNEMLIAFGRSNTREVEVARTITRGITWTTSHWLVPAGHGTVTGIQAGWRNSSSGTLLVQSGKPLGPVQATWLYTTADGGVHWILVNSSVSGTLPQSAEGVTVSGSDHVWIGAGKYATHIYLSQDGGRHFAAVTLPGSRPSSATNTVRFFPSLHFFGTGSYGVWLTRPQGTSALYETRDGGTTWSRLHAFPGPQHPALSFLNSHEWWLVDASMAGFGHGSGEIWQTLNGGVTWTALGTPALFATLIHEKNSLSSLRFVSPTAGYAVWGNRHAHETITVTTDGGKTWRILKKLSQTSPLIR